MIRPFTLAALLLALLVSATCRPRIDEEQFSCDPETQQPCPSGWRCVPFGLQHMCARWDFSFTCGDGKLEIGEQCDASTLSGDECDQLGVAGGTPYCVKPSCFIYCSKCGNGVLDPGEACDDGDESVSCNGDCTASVCGDGVLNVTAGETCDTLGAGDQSCCIGGIDACHGELDTERCGDCGNGICERLENHGTCPADCNQTRDVDLLFVIDNSGGMEDEQATLRSTFGAMTSVLRNSVGGTPNVHVGVTTTDLGTVPFQINNCETVGGDGGYLQTGSCANPFGGNSYIIDTEPRNCTIERQAGVCTAHTCDATGCAHEPSTTLVEDETTACPRCRNYQAESLEDVFSCIADLGTIGCGFEQPLEAMYKALNPSNIVNPGFLRQDSILAVVLFTDEDDCSASDLQLFDNTQTEIDSTLGPLTSFRCFEFGITCDINERTHVGLRKNCVPREDAQAMLHPISRYADLLMTLRDPGRIILAAIGGPVTPSNSGGGYDVEIGLDVLSQPELQYSCNNTSGGAVPGIRIASLVSMFNHSAEMGWAYSRICDSTYASEMDLLGLRILRALE